MSDKSPPVHAAMPQFPVADNCLQIGGRTVTEIAAEVGSTPFYAYDGAVMAAQVDKLRRELPINLSFSITSRYITNIGKRF